MTGTPTKPAGTRDATVVGRLRADLTLAQARADQLQNEVARCEAVIGSLEGKLEKALERIAALDASRKDRETEAEGLRRTLSTLQEQIQNVAAEQAGDRSASPTARSEILATQLTAAMSSVGDWARQLSDVSRRIEELDRHVRRDGEAGRSRSRLGLPQWLSLGRLRGRASPGQVAPSLSEQAQAIERSRMFDARWYLERYPDVAASGADPITHYITYGWREGRDPAPGFSTTYYREANPEIQTDLVNPLYHYLIIGRYQGRSPTPDAKYIEELDQAAIVGAEFDDEFYRQKSGLRLSAAQALEHFLRKGWKEGRDPHPQFSTRYYLKQNADVWRAGVNPYVHYLIAGRKEGRFPRQLPGLNRDLTEQWRVIAGEFDVPFYLAQNPDVAQARFEPILHYLLEGWKRERDPHPQFSTSHYLDANPDVRKAGVNPYFHFLAEGRKEGRPARPAGTWALKSDVRGAIEERFDRDFYLARNPDVAAAKMDPLDHYVDYGWKEGRDPCADFSTSHYLESNGDVAAAGVNPFYHYLTAGRSEGRAPMHPGGWRAAALQRLRPLAVQIEDANAGMSPAANVLSAGDIVDGVRTRARSNLDRIFLTVSHDDYTRSVGGVQLCLTLEQQSANARGITHVNLHPMNVCPTLSRDTTGDEDVVVVTCDGEAIGAAKMADVRDALAELRKQASRVDLSVHSLLSHSPEGVARIREAIRPERSFLWLHDFLSLCPSYTLLRNGINFCHAPKSGSPACRVCVFGEEREDHERRIKALFARVPFEVLAPSEFAAAFWRSKSDLPVAALHVNPHCRLRPTGERTSRQSGPVRVAFLGHPAAHKGWEAFVQLLREFEDDERYEFHHLGAGRRVDRRTRFTRVSVLDDGPTAMADALAERQIEVVLLWSIWPETFSFVAHEALCAGAAILTNEASGNIAQIVRDKRCGVVLKDEGALAEAFRSGAVQATARGFRNVNKETYAQEFSEMTLALLDEDAPR